MGEGPWNVSGRPVPIAATTNSHDNRAGLEAVCKTGMAAAGCSELHVDLADASAEIRICGGFDPSSFLF